MNGSKNSSQKDIFDCQNLHKHHHSSLWKKKDAKKLRPCQDYWYLNEFTKPNAYPLPLISDLMITLKGSKFFTKLDIRWGYNNVRIKEGDEWKAAFITNKGLFELTVMFFGLRNSPATFQAMMDDYFRDMIDEGWIAIYMDDILIHARTKEDLEKRTKRVLKRLKEHNLYLKPEKCKFERTEVEFLGTIISPYKWIQSNLLESRTGHLRQQ
jgi:hypothetical protein